MPLDPNKLNGQKAEQALPYDPNNHRLSAVLLPIVDVVTGKITGYIPLAYTVDMDGKAVLHIKVIP